MKYVISNQVSGHVYVRFPFVSSIRDEGPAPQVQNLSWAIVLFKNKVAHQSRSEERRVGKEPNMHGLWPHEGGGNRSESPQGVFDKNPFCVPAWSRAVTGI